MSDKQHEGAVFFARHVKRTKTLPPTSHLENLSQNTDEVEFAWTNLYTPPKGYTPALIDIQHFVQGVLVQGFVPFGVHCSITSPGAGTIHLATNPTDVFKPQSVHEMLMKCIEVTHAGVWGMNAKHPTHLIKSLIDDAVEQSPIYKALKDAGLEPEKTSTPLDYQRSEEGNIIMLHDLVLVIDEAQYMNRFGAFAKIAKQFNLQVFDITKAAV